MARIIVTRPQPQAQRWIDALSQLGHQAQAQALIEIAPLRAPADQKALQEAKQNLAQQQAVMFVSHFAVAEFFKENQGNSLIKPAGFAIDLVAKKIPSTRFWCTGEGTRASLLAQSIAPEQIDSPGPDAPQFDSEALWARVKAQVQRGHRVLIVRGRDASSPGSSGRDWLAEQLLSQGAQVQTLSAYERRAPTWSAAQQQQCQAWLQDGSIWLISSSQALRNLPPHYDVSQALCICTHERITQTVRARGFAHIITSRPSLSDIIASIKSLDECGPT